MEHDECVYDVLFELVEDEKKGEGKSETWTKRDKVSIIYVWRRKVETEEKQ